MVAYYWFGLLCYLLVRVFGLLCLLLWCYGCCILEGWCLVIVLWLQYLPLFGF